MITGNDLLCLYAPGQPAATVADLMTPPITCEADLPLAAAADLIISNEVHRLVVIDASHPSGVPIGVVSTADIVAEMASARSIWQRGSA